MEYEQTKVKLEKHMVIAQISPVNKALPCWATFETDSMDNEKKQARSPCPSMQANSQYQTSH